MALEFSHSKTAFTFQGKELPQPAPGTYDATAWTPPTHRMYRVEVYNNKLWQLYVGNVLVEEGEDGSGTRKWARAKVEAYQKKHYGGGDED